MNISYDDFRGIPEGSWNGNTGGLIGANFGAIFFDFLGVQAGGSYGVYDWYGRGPAGPGLPNGVQQQGFVTGGIFSNPQYLCGFQAGLVVDWMFNKNLGVFALDPSIGQLRLQAGYFVYECNEIGLWGTIDLQTAHKSAFEIPVSFRAISQVNLFWRHIFESCAETVLWVGLPYRNGLMSHGKRAGQYIIGGSFNVPLTSCLSVEAHGVYMGPTKSYSSPRFQSYDANICVGITYAFGSGSNSCCAINIAKPYMSIANNSNFLVDTSLND